jgi:IS30 family transposase
VVAGTDLWCSQRTISRRRSHAGLARNHLPKSLHSGARRAQSRAREAPALPTPDEASQQCRQNGQAARRDHGPTIHSRAPAQIEDRAIPGHWEGDLLAGAKNSHIATLVERTSRFTLLVKVDGKDTQSVVSALTKKVRRLPVALRRSLTWDRGNEMAQHKAFTIATDIQVYFCDPQSPWQRGTNENTNGLLRQYFPDGTELSHFSQAALDKVARRLNERPRKTLGYVTPAVKLQSLLQ